MTEEILVTLPRERRFGPVAGLVLGGVAARHALTVEALDDLQLALETLLDRGAGEGDVNVILRVENGALGASVGPFPSDALAELRQETDGRLGLRRLLDTVVDSVELHERSGGCWVEVRKAYGSNEDD